MPSERLVSHDAAGRRLLVAYLLGFVAVGIGASSIGPALSHLRDQVGTDDGGIAILFVAQSAGYIAGSLLAGRGLDRGHGHRRWVIAMTVGTVSIVVAGLAGALPLMAAAFVVVGACAGIGDVSGNTLVMWSRPWGPTPALNALHLSFAVGAMLAPLVVAGSLGTVDSIAGLAVPLALITAVCAVVMLRSPTPPRTRLDVAAASVAAGARTAHVALVGAFFFAYVAMEVGFASWIHTYVEDIDYGGAAFATGITTIFGVGFVLGRVIAIPVARRVSPGRIVAVTVVLSLVVSAAFWVWDGPGPMLWVMTFLFGLAVAPQYASMMGFAESHLALSGGNTAALVAASGLGGLLTPWVMGQLFDRDGPDVFAPTVLVLSVLVAVVAGAVGWVLRVQRPPATSRIEPVT